jgi:hypothetical protein
LSSGRHRPGAAVAAAASSSRRRVASSSSRRPAVIVLSSCWCWYVNPYILLWGRYQCADTLPTSLPPPHIRDLNVISSSRRRRDSLLLISFT